MDLLSTPQSRPRVAVDLLALIPGGANGGAKLLALDLLRALSGNWNFTCFCLTDAAPEIAEVLGNNVRIASVAGAAGLERAYSAEVEQRGPFALHFFPMQNVSLLGHGTPTISVVHDLQFADMPENFTPSQLREREAAFRSCVEHSDLIVTVSRYSLSRIKSVAGIDGNRVKVIYNSLDSPAAELEPLLTSPSGGYFLYPANFWPHKNHVRLLEAYRIYRKTQVSPLDLILTGEPRVAQGSLADVAKAEPGVHVAGYVDREAFQALLARSNAVIFPSLYEGFGMPVVEAMAARIPVACSNAGSLPEIAGSAALQFDGTDVAAIAEAMIKISTDAQLRCALVAAGSVRQAELGDFSRMSQAYDEAMKAVLAKAEAIPSRVIGVDENGWAESAVRLELSGEGLAEQVNLQFLLPEWVPLSRQTITISSDSRELARATLWPGREANLELELRQGERSIVLNAAYSFSLRDLLDTSSLQSVSYRLLTASLSTNGRHLSLWPNRTPAAQSCDVALVAITEVPENGFSVSVVGISARPVVIRPIASVADARIKLTFDTQALAAPEPDLPVTQVNLSSAPEGPEIDCAAGTTLVALHSPRCADPAKIADVQTEAGFTVIIPSFNQGRFLSRTIDSVLCQDHVLEVLVVDGGSTDTTLDVLSGYGGQVSWWSERDNGQADAVNKGLTRAKGEYIAWINSDDTYAPGALAHVANIFSKDQSVAVIYGDADHIDEDDNFIEPYPTMNFNAAALLDRCFICQPAAFFRRRIAVQHGGLRPSLRYCLDYEFWLRLALAGEKIERTPTLLAHSRMYPENKTLGQRLHAYFETANMMINGMGYDQGQWLEHFANAAADHLQGRFGIPRAYGLREARRLGRAVWS